MNVWHADNDWPSALMSPLFHFNGTPSRFGLPPFYVLHIWAWKNNPSGMFANQNPRVS